MSMNDPNLLAPFLDGRGHRKVTSAEACEAKRDECRRLILDIARISELTAAKGTWVAFGELDKIKMYLQDLKIEMERRS